MTSSPPLDSLRREALGLAASKSWRELAALLAPVPGVVAVDGELALLLAEARMYCGEEREALAWLRTVEPSLASGAPASYRRAINMRGAAHLALGQLDDAIAAFGHALELAMQADDLAILAQSTNNLGAIANQRGNHEEALWHYRLALPALQRLGQPHRMAGGYHNMAITLRDLGQLEESDEHELRAIEYATAVDNAVLVAVGRVGRAEIALRRGDAQLAEPTARLAANELARMGEPWHEADALRVVGVACTLQRKLDDALEVFDRALAIARERGHSLNQADVLRDRAEALLLRGAPDEALRDLAAAAALFTELGAAAEVSRLEARVARIRASVSP